MALARRRNRVAVLIGAAFTLALAQGCALPEKTRAELDRDWALARAIHGAGASRLHRSIFGDSPLDGSRYERYFSERVRRVEGEGILFASCHGALACSSGDGTVRIGAGFTAEEIPAVARLGLLVHEAAHREAPPHEICTEPLVSRYSRVPLQGEAACDRSAAGAYGVQIVMLRNIQRYCSSCAAEVRARAGEEADALLLQISSPDARRILLADDACELDGGQLCR